MGTATRPGRLALAVLLTCGAIGRAEAQAPPMDLPGPAAESAPTPAGVAAVPGGAPSEPPSPPSYHLALFAGSVRHDPATVSGTIMLILSPALTASGTVSLPQATAVGLRFGFVGTGRYRFIGLHLDVQYQSASGSDAATGAAFKYGALTTALVPVVRLPFLRTAWAPGGALDVYAGLSLGLVVADASVSLPALGHPVSDGAAAGWSLGLLAGGSAQLGPVLLFGEVRTGPTHLKLGGGDFSFEEGSAAFDSTTVVAGLGVRF